MAIATHTRTSKAPSLRWPLVFFALGSATGVAMILVGFRAQSLVANTPDPYGYGAMARSLVRGDGFAAYGSVLNRRGPLYPAFIALLYLVAGENPLVVQLAQAAMSGAICALAYDLGRRLYTPRAGIIAGVICALHPALLRYVADFHIETMLTFLATLMLWLSVLFLEKPGVARGAAFGLAAALGALAKPVVLLHPLAFVLWWLFRERGAAGLIATNRDDHKTPGPRRPWYASQWAAAAAIFATMGVVILPWTYRNYRSSGHLVLVTTGFGDAFLRGYIFSKPDYALLRLPPYTFAENESNALFNSVCERAGATWQRNDVESEKILSAFAKEKLRAEPVAFLRKFVVQLFTFWYEMTSRLNSAIAGSLALVLWAFALVGWREARATRRVSWPLFVPILCLNLSLAVLLALGRYSVPILPALTVIAAFGIDTLWRRRSVGA